jgi:polyferredoxin
MLRRLRIPVQLAFLLLFLYLLVRTLGTGEDQLGPPVRIFLEIDPLVGLTTWLRTGALHGLMALSLLTIVLTLLFGRFFCGWVCPLGTLSQISGRLLHRRREEKSADRWRASQRWKFLLLAFVLAGAASGSLWTGLLDPLCLAIRGLAIGFGPPVEWIMRSAAAGLASTRLSALSEPVYGWIRDRALAPRAPHFEQGALLGGILLLLLGLSWARRRFWCRVLCPLGGLLGLVAQAGALRLRQDESLCSGCTVCTFHCQGAADPDQMGGWRPSECFVCGNCTSSCRQSGLGFTFTPPRFLEWLRLRRKAAFRPPVPATVAGPDVGRRRLLIGLGLGFLSGPLGHVSPSRDYPEDTLIRPPGAGPEKEFLDRCVRCGECMKVCPANGLHPLGLEGGPLALWTPVLRPAIGYCEYHCTLCGQVCPTGAIPKLTMIEKERAVLGLAFVDTTRCLPFAYATPCIVCEEHCPTSPKAIVLDDADVLGFDGATRRVRRPRVDPKLCVGCGICEFRCPVEGDAAIRIFATGRTGEGGPFDLALGKGICPSGGSA